MLALLFPVKVFSGRGKPLEIHPSLVASVVLQIFTSEKVAAGLILGSLASDLVAALAGEIVNENIKAATKNLFIF